MGRGMQNPAPYGQMGDLPRFDFNSGQWSHPFAAQPSVPLPPQPPVTPSGPPANAGGGTSAGFPGQGGAFSGQGATTGAFPGGAARRVFPHGATGNTTGRVGSGWGKISGRDE